MKIVKGMCDQCLFSPNKIVDEERKKQILDGCKAEQTHFNCHKEREGEVVCGGFNKTMGQYSQMIRISERLRLIEYVEAK